jgi:hypothetical protein
MRFMRALSPHYARGFCGPQLALRAWVPLAQATTSCAPCSACFVALSFLPAAACVLRPNYSFNATVMCRADNPASLSGALTQVLGATEP